MNESSAKKKPILRWSIGTKLIIAFLVLAIIPMSITAYYNLTHGQEEVAKFARENLIVLSSSTAHRIEQLLVENQRTSAILAGDPSVIQFLAGSQEERHALSPRIYQILKNFTDTHPDYDAPGLLDVNGIVVASLADVLVGKNRSFRDYFQASIKGKSYTSDILVGRTTGRPGVFLTNPVITTQGKIVGIDIVWLKGDTIWNIIDDVKVGKEGITYLVDQDGVIIAHPNRDLLYHSLGKLTPEAVATISKTIRFGTIKDIKTPLIPESLGMDDLAAELMSTKGSGTYRYYSPLDHRNHVVGYTRLEAHPWTVVVDLPEDQFLAPLQRLRSVAWVSVGLVGVITLIISTLLVRSITRPIHHLTDTVIAVEQGQSFEPSDIIDVTSGRDEISRLGCVFSNMVLALRQELKERKQAEEALRESENKYRTLLENLPQKIFVKDSNVTYVSSNENYARELGIKSEDLAGKTDYDFFPKELAEKYRADDKRVMLSGEIENIEEKYIQEGREVWVETVKAPIKDEAGNIIGIQGIFWEITERKQAEEELAKHRNHLEEMVGKRTAELQKTINFMAGREVRMAELKEVIRKLRVQVESAGMIPVADDPLKEI